MLRILLIIAFFPVQASAKVLEVCNQCPLQSIQKAVSKAKAMDTVKVFAGTYFETEIKIDKSLYLIGIDRPVLDAKEQAHHILDISADNFHISGFSFKNVGLSYTKEPAAVFVSNSRNFTIRNNCFDNVFYAFLLHRTKFGLLTHNVIHGNAINETGSGNGFHLWKCSNMRIEYNKVKGMRDGIYLEFVKKSIISYNYSSDNVRYGLHFMFSNHNEYHHNEFRMNGAGVAVMFSKFIKMYRNTFQHNWGTAAYGLLLKEINDAEIQYNTFLQNTIGINVDGCNRIRYSNNQFVRNGWALRFTGGCYANSFELNNFKNNTFDLAYNSRLNDNKFSMNYWSAYSGYDLDKDGVGDVPYRPVKLFSFITNKTPETIILLRSLFIDIINFSEKVSPIFTPDALLDDKPLMRPIQW